MQNVRTVHMQSPEGEIREVEGTTAILTPLMAAGWHQVGASKMFIRFIGQPHEFDDSDGTARASGRGMAFFQGGAA